MYFIGTLNKDVADMNLKCADEKGALTMGEQEAGEHLADLAKDGRRCCGGGGRTAPPQSWESAWMQDGKKG